MPLSGTDEWEYLEFILDSGATATVIPPNVGKADKVEAFTLTSLKIMG